MRRNSSQRQGENEGAWRPRRRTFVAGFAGAITVALTDHAAAAPDPGLPRALVGPAPSFTATLLRRDDFLSLRFEFFNLRLQPSPGPGQPARLVRLATNPKIACRIVVVLPPQHFGEDSTIAPKKGRWDPEAPEPEDPYAPVAMRLSGETRLAFDVSDAVLPLPYTTEALLSWAEFTQRVVTHAMQPASGASDPKPREASTVETAIELPYRIHLSPTTAAGWAHDVQPVRHSHGTTPANTVDVTELWHTRLGRARGVDAQHPGRWVDEHDVTSRTVRAIWALDPAFEGRLDSNVAPGINENQPVLNENQPVLNENIFDFPVRLRLPLNELDRYDLVRLTSDWRIQRQIPAPLTDSQQVTPPTVRWRPSEVKVNRLMLSSLGGWLDARGAWDLPNGGAGVYNSSMLEWRHRAELGRDSYVRVVRKGYACPTGHPASLVKVTERTFVNLDDDATKRAAVLRQRFFLVCREPILDYSTTIVPRRGKKLPFRTIECKTMVSPDLDLPEPFAGPGTERFVAKVNGEPFPFQFVGTDWAGNKIDFTCPVVWVDDTVAYLDEHMTALINAYLDPANLGVVDRERLLQGQRVVVAPSKTPGDTTVQVRSLLVGIERAAAEPAKLVQVHRPGFVPMAEQFTVDLPEAEAAAGKELASKPTFEYYEEYLSGAGNGLGGSADNVGEVFLAAKFGPRLAFDTGASGGVITPDLMIKGISRSLGPFGGEPETIRAGTFDPTEVFALDSAKILGGIPLRAIVAMPGPPAPPLNLDRALTLTSRELSTPRRIETILDWHPPVQNGVHNGALLFVSDNATLDLRAVIVTNLDEPAQSTFSVAGELRSFVLNLFGEQSKFVQVRVRQLRFTAAKGAKPDVDVELEKVEFVGALSYVSNLAEKMGLGDGLVIEPSTTGIVATIGVNFPTIPLGVFLLKGLAVSGGVSIPFDGSPVRVRFAFASREKPFTVTFFGIGGSGFVGLELGVDGVELLEFTFAFAACLELDAGVASGSVEITAGIAYSVETNEDGGQTCELTAFIRFYGELEVLLVVSMSLEFYLALRYVSDGESSKLTGEARVTVTVSVLMVEKDVTIRVRRTLSKSGSGNLGNAAFSAKALEPSADPALSFGSFVSADDWKTYAEAFAPLGA